MTTLSYDTAGDLYHITDPHNYSVQYTYDTQHRITGETKKNGRTYTATYEHVSNITTHTLFDSEQNVIARASTTVGFPARGTAAAEGDIDFTDGRGNHWIVHRDNLRRVTKITAPGTAGYFREREFGDESSGANDNKVISVTNERGKTREFNWDSVGKLHTMIDEENNEHEFNHSPFTSLLVSRTEPDGDEWTFDYDTNGDLLTITDPLDDTMQGASQDAVITFAYETHSDTEDLPNGVSALPGRIKKITRTDRNGHAQVFEYDTMGNLVKVTRAFGELDLVAEYEYDAMGRWTQKTVHRGDRDIIYTRTYDALGRVLTAVEDHGTGKLNLTTTRVYDGEGHLISTTDPRQVETTFSYDYRSRLESKTQANGALDLTTAYEYDGNRNIVEITGPDADTRYLYYNEQNFVERTVDEEGFETEYERDGVGNITRVDRGRSPGTGGPYFSVSTTYDDLNRIATKIVAPGTGSLNLLTIYDYAPVNGSCSCAAGTPGKGLLHKVTDPEGKVTYYDYDKLDRVVKTVRKAGDTADNGGDSNDAVTEREYDPNGNITAVLLPEGERREFVYDEANRRTEAKAIDPLVSANNLRATYGYDDADNIISYTPPNNCSFTFTYDGANRLTQAKDNGNHAIAVFTYDGNGNVLTRSDGETSVWAFDYDELNRVVEEADPLIESPDKSTTLVYDDVNNRVDITNNLGVVSRHQYDGLRRLIATIENYGGSGDTADTSTTFEYNGLDGLISLADHDNNTTTYDYDDAGRARFVHYPDDDVNGAGTVEYDYDGAGNLVYRKDQRGIETEYGYDDLHHLVGLEYSTGLIQSFLFDREGRPLHGADAFTEVDFAYDALGRLSSTTQTHHEDDRSYTTTIDYYWDGTDTRYEITYPDSRVVKTYFDARLRPRRVSTTGLSEDYTYDLADRRTGIERNNGVDSVLDYDVNSRLMGIQHANQAGTLFEVNYGYDAAGNPLYREDVVDSTLSELYGHDPRNRLRSFGRGTLSGGKDSISTTLVDAELPGAEAWSDLDRRGNWLEWSNTTNNTTVEQTRTASGVNEYLTLDRDGSGSTHSPQSLAYDANGNLTEDPSARNAGDTSSPSGQRYNYDEENRLTAVNRSSDSQVLLEIVYDAFGRRIQTIEYVDPATGNALTEPKVTRHIPLGHETIEEYDLTDGGETCTLARQFVWGAEYAEPVGFIDYTDAGAVSAGTAECFSYLRDRPSSVVSLVDGSGTVVEEYRYDAYGRTHIYDGTGASLASSALANPLMWTGQRFDAGVRLYHFMFRSYSPSLGHWLQREPLGYVAGPNLYSYVANSPLYYIDYLGLNPIALPVLGVGGGAARGGAIGAIGGPIGIGIGIGVGAGVGCLVSAQCRDYVGDKVGGARDRVKDWWYGPPANEIPRGIPDPDIPGETIPPEPYPLPIEPLAPPRERPFYPPNEPEEPEPPQKPGSDPDKPWAPDPKPDPDLPPLEPCRNW